MQNTRLLIEIFKRLYSISGLSVNNEDTIEIIFTTVIPIYIFCIFPLEIIDVMHFIMDKMLIIVFIKMKG